MAAATCGLGVSNCLEMNTSVVCGLVDWLIRCRILGFA